MNHRKPWLDLEQLTQRLCKITAEQTGHQLAAVRPESRLIEDLNCDSLELLELIMEVEYEFGLTIPETPTTPVGKLIFTRSPFRVRDLAEFAFLNQGTGTPVRSAGRRSESMNSVEPERKFSQLGGRWSRGLDDDSLFEALESDKSYPMCRRKSDGMVCLHVPACTWTIGSNDSGANEDEKPSHQVSLSSFLIDIEPVSVTAFCRFLNSIDATPTEVQSLVGLPSTDDRVIHVQYERLSDRWAPKTAVQFQPIVLISWFAANAYSLWANGSDWREFQSREGFLPSEAQWERVSQGAFSETAMIQAGIHQL